jgi:hypothetical protein
LPEWQQQSKIVSHHDRAKLIALGRRRRAYR